LGSFVGLGGKVHTKLALAKGLRIITRNRQRKGDLVRIIPLPVTSDRQARVFDNAILCSLSQLEERDDSRLPVTQFQQFSPFQVMPIAGSKIKFDVHPLVFLNFAHRQAHKVALIRTDFHNLWFLEQFRMSKQRQKVELSVKENSLLWLGAPNFDKHFLRAEAELKRKQKTLRPERHFRVRFVWTTPPRSPLLLRNILLLDSVGGIKAVERIGANSHHQLHIFKVDCVQAFLELLVNREHLELYRELEEYL